MQRIITIWAGLLAAIIAATSIFGAAHFFSSIPWQDQWDGYVGFFHTLADGNRQAWWSPQMEHRIVFSRALFWIDGHVFGGWNVFTIVGNFLLMSCLCVVLVFEAFKTNFSRLELAATIFLIFGFLFSWIQYANFTSGFQSQFIAVYLFAFLGFAQYSRAERGLPRVALAILFCLLSVLSMANGLIALVVMAIQGVLLRRPAREIGALLVVSVIVGWLYLHNQVLPQLPISEAMQHAKFFKIKFFFVFLGNPAYYFGQSNLLAGLVGLLTFLFAAAVVVYLYVSRKLTAYQSFLIASYGFIVASELGATRSRWMLGYDGATASRYATPSLIALVLLMLLALDLFTNRRRLTLCISGLFLTLLLPLQQYAFGTGVGMPHFDRDKMFNWKLAVLGQKIGLDHPEFDGEIFPLAAHDRYVNQTNFAAATNIGPYGAGWLHDAGIVKYDSSLRDDSLCVGFVDATGADAVGRTATGWVIAKRYAQPSTLVLLVDAKDQTVGYGVTGINRPDVAIQQNASKDAGWFGFAKSGIDQLQAYAYVGGKFCRLMAAGK